MHTIHQKYAYHAPNICEPHIFKVHPCITKRKNALQKPKKKKKTVTNIKKLLNISTIHLGGP